MQGDDKGGRCSEQQQQSSLIALLVVLSVGAYGVRMDTNSHKQSPIKLVIEVYIRRRGFRGSRDLMALVFWLDDLVDT